MLDVEAIVAEKLYAESMGRPAEKFALLDKIREFMRIISRWPTIQLGCRKIPLGDGPQFDTDL